jgi:hypothetical protein
VALLGELFSDQAKFAGYAFKQFCNDFRTEEHDTSRGNIPKLFCRQLCLHFQGPKQAKIMTPWGLSQYLVFINQDRGLTYVIRVELTELAMIQS